MKRFFRRQSIIPFETTFAVICVFSGIAGICEFGPANYGFREVLGGPISISFNCAYILAGLTMFFSIGFSLRAFEAFGIVLIAMSLLVRSIVLYHYGGLTAAFISLHVYSLAFFVACMVRLAFLLTDKAIVEADTLGKMFREIERLKAQRPHVLI